MNGRHAASNEPIDAAEKKRADSSSLARQFICLASGVNDKKKRRRVRPVRLTRWTRSESPDWLSWKFSVTRPPWKPRGHYRFLVLPKKKSSDFQFSGNDDNEVESGWIWFVPVTGKEDAKTGMWLVASTEWDVHQPLWLADLVQHVLRQE